MYKSCRSVSDRWRWVWLAVYTIFGLSATFAQTSREFKLYSTESGPVQAEIRGVIEAGNGDVWVASWGSGVYRLHGMTSKRYQESDGFPSNWTTSIAEDASGAIWLGTGDGLIRFDEDGYTTYAERDPNGIPDEFVTTILQAADGSLLLGTARGYVLRINPLNHTAASQWEILAKEGELGASGINDLVELPEGGLVVSTTRHGVWSGGKGSWHTILDGVDWLMLESHVQPDGSKEVWGVPRHEDAVYIYRDGVWSAVATANDVGLNVYSGLDGQVYHLGDKGVWVYRDSLWAPLDFGPTVGAPRVLCMLTARDGAVWLGTMSGLIRGARRAWTGDVFADDGSRVNVLVRDVRGQATSLRAVTGAGNLAEYEHGGWRFLVGLADVEDVKDWWVFPPYTTLWGRRDNEILEYALGDGSLTRSFATPDIDWNAKLYQTDDRRFFYLSDFGVHERVGGQWIRRFSDPADPKADCYALKEVGDGQFYLGRIAGLELWSETEKQKDIIFNRAADVRSIAEMDNGALWIGTYGVGALRLNTDGTVTEFGPAQGFSATHVSYVMEQGDGTLWLALRQSGVASYRDERLLMHGFTNGLPYAGVEYMAESEDGVLWASTDGEGVYEYHADSLGPNTRIVVRPDKVAFNGVGVFSFDAYDAWNDTNRANLLYSWRVLEGGGENEVMGWSVLSPVTTIALPVLDPGNYVFEVRSADDRRNWDEFPARAGFSVSLPFWRQPEFLLPLVLLAMMTAVAILVTYRMRSSRVAAEKERAESNERLATLIMNVPGCVYKMTGGPGYHLVYLSPAFTDIAGVDPELYVREKAPRWRDLVYPEDWQNVVEPQLSALAPGDSYRLEYRIHLDEGRTHWVVDQGRMTMSEGAAAPWIDGILHDVTERKSLEDQLRESQKMEAVGQLAGGVAHDFNNLLQVIVAHSDLLTAQLSENSEPMSDLMVIQNSAEKASGLVKQLLAFGRRQVIRLEAHDLNAIVEDAMQMFRRTIPKNIEVDVVPANGLPLVLADAGQIQQVLVNLAVNARDAMPDGGALAFKTGAVSFDHEERAAHTWATADRYVFIQVADTGVGMDEETQLQIFEPFFTTKEVGRGTGLGLSMVYGIIKQHQGGIVVESTCGVGTVFSIYLPLA